jgi:WD40 repeat protein
LEQGDPQGEEAPRTLLAMTLQNCPKLTQVFFHEGIVTHAAFSPDGRHVLTASWDNTARVWDAATGQPITHPLKHQERVDHAAFSPDKRRVLTASWDKTARVWDILSDDRAAGDLILLAQLLSGSRVETNGALVPLKPQELRAAWQALREKYPSDFVGSDREVLAWHRREAADCEAQKVWDSAVWHLDRLIASGPVQGGLFARRGRAYAGIGRWEEAIADDSKVIDMESNDATHWINRGDAYAELSRWDRASSDYLMLLR